MTRHLSHAALLSAADDNLVMHASWIHQQTPGMRVASTPELVVVDSGLPCDTFNLVCRARLNPATALPRIRAAIDSFTRTGRPFSWWHGPADQPPDLATYLLLRRWRYGLIVQAAPRDAEQVSLCRERQRLWVVVDQRAPLGMAQDGNLFFRKVTWVVRRPISAYSSSRCLAWAAWASMRLSRFSKTAGRALMA